MRAIAQELGSTTGVVTHYFRDKDELMLFVLDRVFENLNQQMQSCIERYCLCTIVVLPQPLDAPIRNPLTSTLPCCEQPNQTHPQDQFSGSDKIMKPKASTHLGWENFWVVS